MIYPTEDYSNEDSQIVGIMIDWNKKHKRHIDINQENIARYKKWWTLTEITEWVEIYTLVKDLTHCPWVINYIEDNDF